MSLKDEIDYGVRTSPMMSDVKALIFDVFGTVVDWRTSVARMAREFAELHGIPKRIGFNSPAIGETFINLPWKKLEAVDFHSRSSIRCTA